MRVRVSRVTSSFVDCPRPPVLSEDIRLLLEQIVEDCGKIARVTKVD